MIEQLVRLLDPCKKICLVVCLVAALMVPALNLDAADLEGDIRLQTSKEGPFWVGQQIQLNLDIWTDGFSFSGQRFLLPEVDGAYLMQVDSSTIKLSEQREGETWQGLRYTILVYVQKAGRVRIPSFPVEFAAGAGYGSETTRFRLDTPALEIESRLPPGVSPGELLVATGNFTMRYQWTPDVDADQPLELKTGDALTLTVDRMATDVPGMVFTPLPDYQIDGIQAYVNAPGVNDSANRGELKGRRSDSVTFICEREGSFEIPAITFQWWDPVGEVLNQETIPGVVLNVVVNPAFAGADESAVSSHLFRITMGEILVILGLALFASVAAWKGSVWVRSRLLQRRLEFEAGERWAFERMLSACRSGDAAKTYKAINLWMSRYLEPGVQLTVLGLARKSGQQGLVDQVERLQAALIEADGAVWDGKALANGLQRLRSADTRHNHRSNDLASLNPMR